MAYLEGSNGMTGQEMMAEHFQDPIMAALKTNAIRDIFNNPLATPLVLLPATPIVATVVTANK